MILIALFIIGTLLLFKLSRRALTHSKSHGFYRFFVFEGILLLVLLNSPYWFDDPFSPVHLLSWSLLFISIAFIVNSLMMLKQSGGYAQRDDTPENFSFENTVNVVDVGLYRFIRHPMYSSLLFLAWGVFFKHITLLNIVLILSLSGLLVIVAKVEERENIDFFGPPYEKYMQQTKMFIPWLL